MPEGNTPERELINLLRNYLNANIGLSDKVAEVKAVVNLFYSKHEWPHWYAIKLAAERGEVTLLNSLHFNRPNRALAFEAFAATGQFELARLILPPADSLSRDEIGDGLRYFGRTGLKEGARLLLEHGPISLTDRIKATKTALSHGHCSIAKIIATTF